MDLRTELLIGGEFVDPSGPVIEHIDPSTGRVQARVQLASPSQVTDAVRAARSAATSWRWVGADQRRSLLREVAALIRRDADLLCGIAARENGTTIRSAVQLAVQRPAEWFDYYAGWCDKLDGSVLPAYPGARFDLTVPEPYGVVGIIITWNAPVLSIAMKVAPALAAGNCVVLKPPELAPFSSVHLARLFVEAGFPPGVVNVVPAGPDGGEALVRDPGVDKLSFTGGIRTARRIAAAAAERVVPVVYELGGKSAQLIFPDADVREAISWSVGSTMMVAGQGCALPTRILVHRSVYEEAVAHAQAMAEGLQVGPALDPATDVGPLISRAALERVHGMVTRARQGGAHLVTGGDPLGGDGGFFYPPTILAGVDPGEEIAQQEVFGPVQVVMPFESEQEAIAIANATRYGLAASVWTQDLERALRVSRRLEAGTVTVNAGSTVPASGPFGGVKQSGYGREGGRQGIEEFINIKRVSIGLEQGW